MKGRHREGQIRLFSAQLLLPSEGSPGRLGFQIGIKNPDLGQKVEAGLGPWREQTREDFLEEAVYNIPERMGQFSVGRWTLNQGLKVWDEQLLLLDPTKWWGFDLRGVGARPWRALSTCLGSLRAVPGPEERLLGTTDSFGVVALVRWPWREGEHQPDKWQVWD